MAKTKLTSGRIADFKCPTNKAQAFLWCAEVPGLAVRATPGSNRKRYVFESKVKGRTMRLTIGDVSVWSIANAQVEARRLTAMTNDSARIDGMTLREFIIDSLDFRINYLNGTVKLDVEDIASLNAEKEGLSLITAGPIKGVYNCPSCMVVFDVTNNSPVTQWHFDMEGTVLIERYGVCNFSTKGYTVVHPQDFGPGKTREINARCINSNAPDAAAKQNAETDDSSQVARAVFNGDDAIARHQRAVDGVAVQVAELSKMKQDVTSYQW